MHSTVAVNNLIKIHWPNIRYQEQLPFVQHKINNTIECGNIVIDELKINYDQPKISDLIKEKYEKKERFYGIEITSETSKSLNYNAFKILPLFTSIVWLSRNVEIKPISDITALQCAKILSANGIVSLSHLSCYKMSDELLKENLNYLNTSNILAVRGDSVHDSQEWKYGSQLVTRIRELRQDTISIGVGGYPDNHPESFSAEEDLQKLKIKVDSGADFMITQICFSAEQIKTFIRNCRKIGITIPIIPGIYTPSSYEVLKRILKVTNVNVPKEVNEEFQKFQDDDDKFREFAIKKSIEIIKDLFDSDLNILGVQLFTFNNFAISSEIIEEIF